MTNDYTLAHAHSNKKSMSLRGSLHAFKHSCDGTIARIQEAHPYQDCLIAVSDGNNANEEFVRIQTLLNNRTGSAALLKALKRLFSDRKTRLHDPVTFVGCIQKEKPPFIGGFMQQRYTNLIVIDIAHFINTRDIKAELYKAYWEILTLQDSIQGIHSDGKDFRCDGNVYFPNFNAAQKAYNSMLGDAFAGILQELEGTNRALDAITKTRCINFLAQPWYYSGIEHPFPCILDATYMAFNEMHKSYNTAKAIMAHAIEITREVEASVKDENRLLQWNSFAQPAQEMAYFNTDLADIIGSSIYSSDNIYIRSIAYTVATVLNVKPTLQIGSDRYNPYADVIDQEKAHIKGCINIYDYIDSKFSRELTQDVYTEIAWDNCRALMNGEPSGWCAPALLRLAAKSEHAENMTDAARLSMFQDSINAITWQDIRNIHRDIIFLKRRQQDVTFQTLIELCLQNNIDRDAIISLKELAGTHDHDYENIETKNTDMDNAADKDKAENENSDDTQNADVILNEYKDDKDKDNIQPLSIEKTDIFTS